MKTRQEILKERYGFDKGSYQYVPRGAEILKMIGQTALKWEWQILVLVAEVIIVDF